MSTNGGSGNESHSIIDKFKDYIPLLIFVGMGGMLVQQSNSHERRLGILEAQVATQAIAIREVTIIVSQVSNQLTENTRRWEKLQDYLGKPRQ